MLLDMRLQIAFGADRTADPDTWVWTDVTQWLHMPDPIRVRWPTGSADGRSPAASEFECTLKNDGRFTWGDPRSPYWPHVVGGVPVRFEISTDGGQTWYPRFQGYADGGWPTSWPGHSGRMALTKLVARGPLHRLVQGQRPVRSALMAGIMARLRTASGALLACWPCEDGPDAEQVASALPGHPPMTPAGVVRFAAIEPRVLYGALPLPDLTEGGSLTGHVARTGTTSPIAWTVQFFGGLLYINDVVEIPFPYTAVSWVDSAGGEWTLGTTGTPNHATQVTYNGTTILASTGTWLDPYEWRIEATQDGSDIKVRASSSGHPLGTLVPGGTDPVATISNTTLGWPTIVSVNPARAVTKPRGFPVGYIQVWEGTGADVPSLSARLPSEYTASGTYPGYDQGARAEPAHYRVARVCTDSAIPIEPIPSVDAELVTYMAAQQRGTDMEAIAAAELADGGILHEAGWGLRYVPRQARYNRSPDLIIDAGARELSGDPSPRPAEDREMRNEWTASRIGGSSYTASDPDHITRHDLLPSGDEYLIHSDRPLAGIAHWAVHLGTDESPRYDGIAIDLHSSPHLIDDWLSCRLGSWVLLRNMPPQHQPYDTMIVIEGADEEWRGRRWWRARIRGSSATPWRVAEVSDPEVRIDTEDSVLAGDLDADGMTLSIATSGALWTTDPDDFPLELRVGGERITVAEISGTSSPQTAIVAPGGRTLGIAWPAGTPVRVWAPAIVAR